MSNNIKFEEKGKIFNGAGIMLLEDDNNGINVILFGNINFNKTKNRSFPNIIYSLLGGKIDKIDTQHADVLASTAIREAYEESCELINIQRTSHINSKNNYCDVLHKKTNTYYRCFFIKVKHNIIKRNEYIKNKQKQRQGYIKIKSVWRETETMTKVPLINIFKNININESAKYIDVNNKEIIIDAKTTYCLYIAFKKMIFNNVQVVNFIKEHVDSKIVNANITQLKSVNMK